MTKISNQYSLTNILTADLANSRLGINNVSPTVALDVTGAGKFSSSLLATSYNATTQNIFAVDGTERMRITSTGNVGINSTTPGAVLPSGNGWTSQPTKARVLQISSTDSNGNSGVFIRSASNAEGLDLWSDNWFGDAYIDSRWDNAIAKTYFRLRTAGTPITAMTLTTTGVGIGTSSPDTYIDGSAGLAINGSARGVLSVIGTSSTADEVLGRLLFTNTNTTNAAKRLVIIDGVRGADNNSGYLTFSTANSGAPTERMRITSAGNVGIGTSSPSFALDVASTSADSFRINRTGVAGTGSASSMSFQVTQSNGQSATLGSISGEFMSNWGGDLRFYTKPANGTPNDSVTERMRITSGGNLLVGTTSAGTDFSRMACATASQNVFGLISTDDSSGAGFLVLRNSATTFIGGIARVGTTNAVAFNTSSDYRLKEDLKEIKGLEKVCAIKVYDFKWKDNIARMDGVLAHELQEVLPYAVTGIKDGDDMQGVDYSKIVPVLVKAIQELSAKVSLLENK